MRRHDGPRIEKQTERATFEREVREQLEWLTEHHEGPVNDRTGERLHGQAFDTVRRRWGDRYKVMVDEWNARAARTRRRQANGGTVGTSSGLGRAIRRRADWSAPQG